MTTRTLATTQGDDCDCQPDRDENPARPRAFFLDVVDLVQGLHAREDGSSHVPEEQGRRERNQARVPLTKIFSTEKSIA
jgi:hypothetical protein